MKKQLNILSYLLKLGFKNILKGKLRSLLLLVSFTGISLTLYLSVTSNQFLTLYYQNQITETYQDFDIKLETNQTFDARFFSITPLQNMVDSSLHIRHYLSIFELNTIAYHNLNSINVKTIAADKEPFFDYLNLNALETILDVNDIMISKSLSRKESLVVNDIITFQIGNIQKEYTVKYIVKDTGLFSGDVVFIHKQDIIKDLITTLSPGLPAMPDLIYQKFSNKLYLSLHNKDNYSMVVDQLKNIPEYENLVIGKPFHLEKINQLIDNSTTYMTIITYILSFSMLLFLYTNIMIFYHNRKHQQMILSQLGYSNKQTFVLLLIELFLLSFLGVLLGIVLGQTVINYGLDFMGSSARFSINYLMSSIIALVILTIYVVSLLLIRLFSKQKQHPLILRKSIKKQSFILICLLIIVVLLHLIFNNALFNVISSTVLLIYLSLYLVTILLSLIKKTRFNLVYYLFKITSTKTVFKYYLVTVLISFVSIFILFYVNTHVDKRIDTYKNEYRLDFIMTNLNQRYDNIYSELLDDNNLSVSKAYIYQNVKLLDQYIGELVIMNPGEIKNHYNLLIDDAYINNLNDESIILPYKYHYLLGLNVGENVLIEVNQDLSLTYKIAGFFDKQLGNMAFVCLNEDITTPNLLLISTFNDHDDTKDDLTSSYAKHLIFLIDYDQLLTAQVYEMNNIKTYMNIVIFFILVSFIFSIINHSTLLYQSLKLDCSRLDVLGLSKKQFKTYLIIESLIIYTTLITFSLVLYLMVLKQLHGLYLFLNVYEKLWFQLTPIVLSMILTASLFILIRSFYQKKLQNLTFSSEFKKRA